MFVLCNLFNTKILYVRLMWKTVWTNTSFKYTFYDIFNKKKVEI